MLTGERAGCGQLSQDVVRFLKDQRIKWLVMRREWRKTWCPEGYWEKCLITWEEGTDWDLGVWIMLLHVLGPWKLKGGGNELKTEKIEGWLWRPRLVERKKILSHFRSFILCCKVIEWAFPFFNKITHNNEIYEKLAVLSCLWGILFFVGITVTIESALINLKKKLLWFCRFFFYSLSFSEYPNFSIFMSCCNFMGTLVFFKLELIFANFDLIICM